MTGIKVKVSPKARVRVAVSVGADGSTVVEIEPWLVGRVRVAGDTRSMSETRLADVPAPRWFALWAIIAWLVDLYGRVVVQRSIAKALERDVIPSMPLIAKDIVERREAAADYDEEMRQMNAQMVTLSQHMVWLTWAVVVLTVIAAGASVAALVVALG